MGPGEVTMTTPLVNDIKRDPGIAGQYSITARVIYPGELPETITFVGSSYGGPIVMITPSGQQVFVSRAVTDRLGEQLSPEWVRGFFGERE